MSDRLRDAQKPWAQTPLWLALNVPAFALRVWVVVAAKYARRGSETAWPSLRTLAEDLGSSEDTVRRAIRHLEAVGALIVEERQEPGHRQTSNVYTILYPGLGVAADLRPQGSTGATPRGSTDATLPLAEMPPLEPEPMNQNQLNKNDAPSLRSGAGDIAAMMRAPCDVWLARMRSVGARKQEQVAVLVDMVEAHTGTKREGGKAAEVLRIAKDPERAVRLVYQSLDAEGDPFRLAIGRAHGGNGPEVSSAVDLVKLAGMPVACVCGHRRPQHQRESRDGACSACPCPGWTEQVDRGVDPRSIPAMSPPDSKPVVE